MKRILTWPVLMMLAAYAGLAADSTFSKDKKHAYLVVHQRPELIDLDFQRKTCEWIDLSKSCGEAIQDITLSNTGLVLFTTDDALWSYNPANEACVKMCDAPKDEALKSVAFDPITEGVLAITYYNKNPNGFYQDSGMRFLPKNGKEFLTVFNRYSEYASEPHYPVYTSDGDVLFVCNGDLWEGSIKKENSDEYSDGRYGSLWADRCAPMAQLVSLNGTPTSTGLTAIAASENEIYANDSRIGGSGWGSFIRFRRPSTIKMSDNWRKMRRIFASVEEIAKDPCGWLCSSQDGLLTLFTTYDSQSQSITVFLVHEDGKPLAVEFKGLADLKKTP